MKNGDRPERHSIFPPHGFWEVTWVGPVSYRRGKGQFSVHVVVSERAPNPYNKSEPGKGYTGRVEVRRCGVGELANLAVGVIAKDRVILSDDLVKKARRKYHAEEVFSDVIRDKIEPEFVLDEGVSESARPPETVGPFRNTPCLFLYSRSRHEKVLVPHIELIRALFAGSGDFLKAVLQGTLCNHGQPAKAIFQIDKSFVDPDNPRRVFIVAGRRLKVKEAHVAALLYAHPELWRVVRSVFPHFQVNGITSGRPVFTKATWGHFQIEQLSGTVQTLFFNKDGVGDQGERNVSPAAVRKVLTRITTVAIPPPYDEVVVLHPIHSAAPGDKGVQRFHLREIKPQEIDIQDEVDPSLTHGGRVFIESPLLGESLRSLASMKIKHLSVVKHTGPVAVTIPDPRSEKMVGSTADPGFGGGDVAVVDFVVPEEECQPTNPEICRRLYAAAQATQILAGELGGEAYELVSAGHSHLSLPPKGVTFPVEQAGIDLPWSMYDEELGWVRRAFVGLLRVRGAVVYVIDAEVDREDAEDDSERSKEWSTLLVLRSHGDVELGYPQSQMLLAALSKARGTWSKIKDIPGVYECIVHSDTRLVGEVMARQIKNRIKNLGIS